MPEGKERAGVGRHWGLPLTAFVVLALIVAACGAPPTGTTPPDESGSSEPTEDPFLAVYGELEGLSGEERTAKLIELANEEGGMSVYTSNTDMPEMAANFEDFYEDAGLTARVAVYRAPADEVLRRMLEENDAGFRGVDLVEIHAPYIGALEDEGILADLESPVLADRDQALVFPKWAVARMTTHVVGWNTDEVGEADVPTSYEDLTDPKYAGIAVEPRAGDWFQTLWKYFESEKGWTDEQNEEYFRALVENGRSVQGFPVQAEFLSTGEVPISAAVYIHQILEAQEKGAPVEWTPIVEPAVIIPTGIAPVMTARSPAYALLFAEWYLTEATDYLAEKGRMPPSELGPGGRLDGVEYIIADPASLIGDEQALWQARWDAIIQGQPFSE